MKSREFEDLDITLRFSQYRRACVSRPTTNENEPWILWPLSMICFHEEDYTRSNLLHHCICSSASKIIEGFSRMVDPKDKSDTHKRGNCCIHPHLRVRHGRFAGAKTSFFWFSIIFVLLFLIICRDWVKQPCQGCSTRCRERWDARVGR